MRRTLAAPPAAERALLPIERALVKWRQERAVVVDGEGNVLLVKKGKKAKVVFEPEDRPLMADHILTHNHPPEKCMMPVETGEGYRTYETGGSLSPKDVSYAARGNAAEVRAVTRAVVDGKQCTAVYSIERPPGGWPPDYLIQDEAESMAAGEKVRLERDIREHRATVCEHGADVMHRVWTKLAPELGLRYKRGIIVDDLDEF